MQHEKIFKTVHFEFRAKVTLSIEMRSDKIYWWYEMFRRATGKRKWVPWKPSTTDEIFMYNSYMTVTRRELWIRIQPGDMDDIFNKLNTDQI